MLLMHLLFAFHTGKETEDYFFCFYIICFFALFITKITKVEVVVLV